jgi:prolyl oligopeptidase
MFDLEGAKQASVSIFPVSAVYDVARLQGDTIAFLNGSYVEPANWFTFDPAEGKTRETALQITMPVNFNDAIVERVMVTSKDGTKVPLNIIRRKDARLDGSNPTLLTGYGGYGVSLKPGFGTVRRLWLDQGGVYAIANLRGGGEFGEEWHKSGNLTKKQNVFDDFAACARYLIDHHYTSPAHLAIEGGSNGGLLMGAVLTQHPELFRAVVSHVGIYDMLRVELSPNGEFNVTEYGTVKDPALFKALYAYSPYHHVVNGTRYPAVLMQTGANDPRVDPANSRKMIARLQAANASANPILLVASSDSGHGIGTALSQVIAQQTDVFAFLFDQLGMRFRAAPAATAQ